MLFGLEYFLYTPLALMLVAVVIALLEREKPL